MAHLSGQDGWVALAGLIVGVVVGLTGMGGGALMTPILVLFFGVSPLAAVSSDLVASAVMKPFGGAVHLWRGTVDRGLVRWLCVGSVPAAFAGALIARSISHNGAVPRALQFALGAALVIAAAGLAGKAYLRLAQGTRRGPMPEAASGTVRVRVLPTVLLGVLGGLVVGITSVGAGSLIVIGLLALYPALRPNDLVGTDLVQAVPLVAAAALAHLLVGDFRLGLTLAVVIGAVPGVLIGSLASARAPAGLVRRVLAFVLLASGLKLLGVGTLALGVTLGAGLLAAPLAWMGLRRLHGLPAVAWSPRRLLAATDQRG